MPCWLEAYPWRYWEIQEDGEEVTTPTTTASGKNLLMGVVAAEREFAPSRTLSPAGHQDLVMTGEI